MTVVLLLELITLCLLAWKLVTTENKPEELAAVIGIAVVLGLAVAQ